MRTKYRRMIFITIFSLIISIFYTNPLHTIAESTGTYIEDFTTTAYLDTFNTNVSGWGNGEIELPRQNPQYLDSIDIGVTNHLYVDGTRAYVGTNDGLFIINIIDPTSMSLIGYYNDSAEIDWLYGCVVQNQLAYLANGNLGLFIVNVTDLSNPTKKGELDLPSVSSDIKLKNQYAYIPAYMGGLQVVDVTDPTAPTSAGSTSTASDAFGVAIVGNYLFVAVSHQGLESFSIASPTSPSHLDTVALNGYARKVEIKGNYAYVACDLGGLQIVDISDPTNMSRVAWLDDNTRYYGVCVENELVYVSGVKSPTGHIMKIYNISDPTNPTPAGFYSLSNTGYDVFVDGDYAYCAATSDGLQSFRIAESGDYYSSRYADFAVATSSVIYTAPVGEQIAVGNPNYIDDALPTDTKVDYYFSADAGANWELCTIGSPLEFQNKGRHLMWKAEFYTDNEDVTPTLSSISIDYETEDVSLSPIYPTVGTYIQDVTPNLDWSDMEGSPGYLLQLSTSASFNGFLLNETLFMSPSNFTVLTPLTEGEYFWRVGYYADFSTFGEFSDTWNFYIGDEPVVPEIQILEFSLLMLSMICVSVIAIRMRKS